jgi:hypothetical protein
MCLSLRFNTNVWQRAFAMIHFSCDRCKREIDSDTELRYVVRLEVQAMMEPCEVEVQDDRDHLLEIQDILERMDDDNVGEDVYQRRRFDLCPSCYRKFIKNPLGREGIPHLNFSKN